MGHRLKRMAKKQQHWKAKMELSGKAAAEKVAEKAAGAGGGRGRGGAGGLGQGGSVWEDITVPPVRRCRLLSGLLPSLPQGQAPGKRHRLSLGTEREACQLGAGARNRKQA